MTRHEEHTMKTSYKFAVLGACLIMLLFDLAPSLVPEAHAIYGVRRRTARRTAVVVSSAESSQTAAAEQQAAAANQQAADAEAEAAATQAENDSLKAAAAAAPAAAAPAGSVPLGTVVEALPADCPAVTIANVEYHQCGGNYYRATFQGDKLVYVTVQP
jgi:hypothetical protein